MNVITIINQISLFAPIFKNQVFGAAEISEAVESKLDAYKMPYAYVVWTGDDAQPSQIRNGIQQVVTVNFSVICISDASADPVGFSGVTAEEACKVSVFASVLGWNPNPSIAGKVIYYKGSGLEESTLPRVIWRFDFGFDTQLTYDDCWHAPQTPMTSITETLAVNNVTLDAAVTLPQA